MGWLFGWNDRRSLVEHLIRDQEDARGSQKTLAHQCAGNNLWCVFEQNLKAHGETPAKTERFIVLFLMRCYPVKGGSKGDREWGYKDISESMGPCEVNCPKKYLDMVPPCGSEPSKDRDGVYEWSRKWRQGVLAYWERRNERQAKRREAKQQRVLNSGMGAVATLDPPRRPSVNDSIGIVPGGLKFQPGRIVETMGVGSIPTEEKARALRRFLSGDWGDLDEGDKKQNDAGLDPKTPDRLMGVYHTKDNTKLWVITEWDRSVTTILLPEEY